MKYTTEDGQRASIARWSVTVTFKNEKQCTKFLKLLSEGPLTYEFSYRQDEDEGYNAYSVDVTSCWANNLTHISKLLERCDYQ